MDDRPEAGTRPGERSAAGVAVGTGVEPDARQEVEAPRTRGGVEGERSAEASGGAAVGEDDGERSEEGVGGVILSGRRGRSGRRRGWVAAGAGMAAGAGRGDRRREGGYWCHSVMSQIGE